MRSVNKDNSSEIFPLVDNNGNVIGKILRGKAHDGSKKLHPVVHLHVFNTKGELFLQKRPDWKDIQPGKWDTSCGGHIDFGETTIEALRREVLEELNITSFTPNHITNYIFESDVEREYVNVYTTLYDGIIEPSEELDGGKFWSIGDIMDYIGKNVFTMNFEKEFMNIIYPIILKSKNP